VEGAPPNGYVIAMSAIYRSDSPPGPAGRWFIDYLKQEDTTPQKGKTTALPSSIAKRINLARYIYLLDGCYRKIPASQNREAEPTLEIAVSSATR